MKLSAIAILLSFFLNFSAICQDINYGNNTKAGKYYKVNGIKIYTETYGKGKPLILFHGNGGNISAFSKTIPYFSKHYKVIAVDTRAHGKSIDNDNELTFEMIADDFARLMETMKIDSAYVIGWSDGGIDALVLALRHAKKVIKIAATGVNMRPDSMALLPAAWKEMHKSYDEMKGKTLTSEKEKNDFKVLALNVFHPNYPPEAMQGVKCPTLIIAGDRDIIVAEHTLEIFKYLPKGQLWILPKSGHATLIEHSDEFNKKVHAFFKEK